MTRDVVVAVGAALGGIAYLWGVSAMPQAAISDPLGPAAFPMLLGVVLLVGAAVQGMEILLRRRGVAARPAEAETDRLSLSIDPFVAAAVLALIAFALLLETLGFVVAMGLLLVVLTMLLDRRQWRLNVVVSLGFAVTAYLLFSKILGVALPRGILPL